MITDLVKLDIGICVYISHHFELIPVSVFLSFENVHWTGNAGKPVDWRAEFHFLRVLRVAIDEITSIAMCIGNGSKREDRSEFIR